MNKEYIRIVYIKIHNTCNAIINNRYIYTHTDKENQLFSHVFQREIDLCKRNQAAQI